MCSSKRKNWNPTNYFFYGWYKRQLKDWQLCFGFCKIQVPAPVSRDLWCHQYGHISCCNEWKIREKKVPYFSFMFSLVIRMVLGLLNWLKETRFYEGKKKTITKKTKYEENRKFIWRTKEEFMSFRIKEKLILRISRGKGRFFSTQEVGRNMIFP